MFVVTGKYNQAKIFAESAEDKAISQILELCNQEFVKDSVIRIMPDMHAGSGCTIGTTMTIQDKVVSNLVGVDIGCGLEVCIINEQPDHVDFEKLDSVIQRFVPSGQSVRSKSERHPFSKTIPFRDIRAPFHLNRAKDSIGTLGGITPCKIEKRWWLKLPLV